MSSAKVTIKEQDRSALVPSLPGIYGGIVVNADKGPVNKPFLITSETELVDTFGEPNLTKGVAHYSAMAFLGQSNKLWTVRAAHEDVAYAGVLVRSKIDSLPTGFPDKAFSADTIIKPIGGLTQEQLDSYSFPVYITNRLYATMPNVLEVDAVATNKLQVNLLDGIEINDSISFSSSSLDLINSASTSLGDDLAYATVVGKYEEVLTFDKIKVTVPVSVNVGDVITKSDGTAYANAPVVVRKATSSTEILVSNADYLTPSDAIKIGTIATTFSSKEVYTETAKFIELDSKLTATKTTPMLKIVQSSFEDRDSFLVVASNQGLWGNDISVGVTPSLDYDDAFNIVVYYQGVQVETWEVSRNNRKDGYGNQMYLEDKINGNSSYIQVIDNLNDVDSDGVPEMPLFSNYSLWRKTEEDLFSTTGATLRENLLKGHTEVKVSAVTNLSMGDRIKFVIGTDKLSAEYKIISIDSVGLSIKIDRPIVEETVFKNWVNGSGSSVNTLVHKFDKLINDSAKGIVNGVQYYPVSKIDKVYYNYRIGSTFSISGVSGKLLDAGANMAFGGFDGSAVTVADYITAINKLNNKQDTPVTILMDGGVTIPAYAQALVDVASTQNLTHCYLSCDPQAELKADYKTAIVDYKASTMVNSEKASIFTGWVKIMDEYNQKEVWVAPDGFAAASQAYTTREFQIFYPAAGWNRGKFLALDVSVKYSEGDRDWFVLNRINPIRYKKGSGLVIWGNETTLVKPSPMQLRSVAMLLIAIKSGLENILEYITFEMGNERTYSLVEGAIDGFMRDEFKAKGGVYDYQVAITSVVTSSDQDNRRMPVFLGIQPTMDIKEIPVTLAIFNKSVEISVNV